MPKKTEFDSSGTNLYHVWIKLSIKLSFGCSGGIGENASPVCARICNGLKCLGLTLDKERNKSIYAGGSGEISTEKSKLKAFVYPTNEELLIARDTVRVVKDAPRRW